MTKLEYIEKFGEEAYELHKQQMKQWYEENKDQRRRQIKKWQEENKDHYKQVSKKWHEENKDQCKQVSKKWHEEQRKNGSTRYCKENYDLIENYELAKADNFDHTKWHLHHRLENYWSVKALKRKGLYYNLNPEALIWLPYKEHKADASKSSFRPEQTKWHQRIYEQKD